MSQHVGAQISSVRRHPPCAGILSCCKYCGSFCGRETELSSCAKICISAENCFPEVVMVDIVREKLCLQTESAALSVVYSVLAVFDVCEICCVELDAGHVSHDRHDAAAGGIRRAGSSKHTAVAVISFNHEVVIISACKHHLGLGALHFKAEGLGSQEVKSRALDRDDLARRNLSLCVWFGKIKVEGGLFLFG